MWSFKMDSLKDRKLKKYSQKYMPMHPSVVPQTLYLIMDSREITSSTKRLFFQAVAPERWMQKQWMTEKSFHALRYIEPPFFHCDEGGQLTPKNQWKKPYDLMNNQCMFNKIISSLLSLRICSPFSVLVFHPPP